MVKKRVPEWLNSSLWSSSASPNDDERLLRYAPQTTTTTSTQQQQPVIQPPTPEPSISTTAIEQEEEEEPSKDVSQEEISRQAQLLAELSRKVVNMHELRRLASQGIPDCSGIRPTVWKLLLSYLPSDRGQWSSELAKKRSQYKHFKEELLVNPER
ncbi:hypothetical protein GIB67_034960 [Kingdonia uniflora]|uniref:Ypt/Rab-GAP domain of gyp1p superfamily protein n=1 Tax=Kingdonia uniflora TaxID=39325 RepID=A0A7J7NGP6_9MAGN|nr:hypothetical protein GIB67_034960 [Kingdonia uniflora]